MTTLDTTAGRVLSFEDVHIGFGQGDVLSGLTFSVVPRETKVLVGESGTGKSLALKLAAGLALFEAMKLGRGSGEDYEKLFEELRQVKTEMAQLLGELTAQTNEVLCKALCFNLSMIVHVSVTTLFDGTWITMIDGRSGWRLLRS